MTVTERLFDNAWYVAHAAPGTRQELAADVTRTWMECEAAREHAQRTKTVSGVTPGRFAVALSLGNAAQAEHDRAKARASEAARCTDIVNGHAFSITRTSDAGSLTVEVASCTLLRRATLSLARPGGSWTAVLTDPMARWSDRQSVPLGTDPWESLHWACDWVVTGAV
ncbi:hypothetical protein [Nostocoides sp. HKS02]|uniref:hypothetical protein n=1 Tax=Nostocoides sp. HKS02 TaxID=1813880 RepID=UPI0012B4B108|nr:hypothetical protein [Tetrasphaera sp. HKS02]QGN58614.1 hypothetical protein GKE56_12805 [Tetrasphaera sp. HKS02]